MGINAIVRRYTVPAIGGQPLVVAYASATEPVRVLIRNEGSGSNEDVDPPAPLHPFNQFAIGGLNSPFTLPMSRNLPCLLATDFVELYSSPLRCYVLVDGGQDILILAPNQYLYAVSATITRIVISVEVIVGLIDQDVRMLNLLEG